ncbi:MAG: arginine repressor [Candidatus Geothermincolia bacterium]
MKRQRQAELLKIIRSGRVRNQRELVDALRAEGFDVSQTTVSRDLGELGLTRLREAGGGSRYAEPSAAADTPDDAALRRAAPQSLLTVEPTGNMVVVKTQPGSAQGLAWAIDAARLAGVAGTVGGDDTILVVCSQGTSSKKIGEQLMKYALEQG